MTSSNVRRLLLVLVFAAGMIGGPAHTSQTPAPPQPARAATVDGQLTTAAIGVTSDG
jgi:hypothetical protein